MSKRAGGGAGQRGSGRKSLRNWYRESDCEIRRMTMEAVPVSDGVDWSRLPAESRPRHIAIIMDGNGRWARRRSLPRIEGHRRGVTSVRETVETCARLGLEQLTLYCFSHENWKRPPTELSFLMHLLRQFLVEERRRILEQGLRFSVIGRREQLDPAIRAEIELTERLAASNQGLHLCLAVNYGSRQELVDATRAIAAQVQAGTLDPADICEQTIADALYTRGMPDPDLVIRTASEMRISNYLLWQISYAELWVTDVCWPDFREPHLFAACENFAQRERRFGGLKT